MYFGEAYNGVSSLHPSALNGASEITGQNPENFIREIHHVLARNMVAPS